MTSTLRDSTSIRRTARSTEIRVAEVNEVYAAVVVGDRAWFAGRQTERPSWWESATGIASRCLCRRRTRFPTWAWTASPFWPCIPRRSFGSRIGDGRSSIPETSCCHVPDCRRRCTATWSSSEMKGHGETCKRLWWLTMGEQLHLSALDHDVGVVGESGPRWEDSSSYCVTSSGDLWACVGDSTLHPCFVGRRTGAIRSPL